MRTAEYAPKRDHFRRFRRGTDLHRWPFLPFLGTVNRCLGMVTRNGHKYILVEMVRMVRNGQVTISGHGHSAKMGTFRSCKLLVQKFSHKDFSASCSCSSVVQHSRFRDPWFDPIYLFCQNFRYPWRLSPDIPTKIGQNGLLQCQFYLRFQNFRATRDFCLKILCSRALKVYFFR